MSNQAVREVEKAMTGASFSLVEAAVLKSMIDARVDSAEIPKSTGTASCALTAVYDAIEKQAGHPDANLAGLAALVNALKPRTPAFANGGIVTNDMNVTDLATVGAR